MKTLKDFHFDPEKSGKILNSWVKASGKGCQKVADETNYSYDTMNNSLHGKIKELSLERVFKVSVCTGHSVCEYIRLMVEGEEIDFADQLHVLVSGEYSLAPYEDIQPAPVQDKTKNAGGPISVDAYAQVMDKAREVNQANLDRFSAMYEANMQAVIAAHGETISKMEESHKEHVTVITKVARQRLKWIIVLALLFVAVVAFLMWEITHPESGVLRLR